MANGTHPAKVAAAPAERARLLLVEDDALMRRFVCMALDELAVDIVEAGTLAQAHAELAEGRFELLLTDLVLPDGHGLDLLRQLQARPELAGTARVVVFSAGVSTRVRTKAAALGAWRVLEKPVSLEALCECVAAALAPLAMDPLPSNAGSPPVESSAAVDSKTAAIEAHFAGNAALYEAFMASTVLLFAADVATADAAILAGDTAALRRLAHNLKTALLLLGASAASAQARGLETAASLPAVETAALAAMWAPLRQAVLALR